MKNKNINIYTKSNQKYIEIIPYDRELNINYVLYCINKIRKEHNEFILSLGSYCIDGLSETNNYLIQNGSILYNKYTQEYRTIKKNHKTYY